MMVVKKKNRDMSYLRIFFIFKPDRNMCLILEGLPPYVWGVWFLGLRKGIIEQDCAGFWFVYKAHPPVHIRICAGGCNAVGGTEDQSRLGGIYFFPGD